MGSISGRPGYTDFKCKSWLYPYRGCHGESGDFVKINNNWLFLFLTPYCIGAICFILFPVVYSFFLSFTDWSIYGPGKVIGLNNYIKIFTDKVFIQSLLNTAVYALIVVPVEMVISIILAHQLNKKLIKYNNFFRTVFFMPFVLSLISVGLVWSWLYSPDFGFISQTFSILGIESPAWLSDPKIAMLSIAISTVWRNTGYYITIFLAGLQSMPTELYDAARVDGAGSGKIFRSVTLPLLSPTIFVSVIIATIWAWQVFDLTYIMTKGGPARSTLSTGLLIYNTAFVNTEIGLASAQGWILLVIVLVLTGLYFLGQRKTVHYEN